MNEKIKSRMVKLLALAQRGVGGERDTAERVLGKLMAQHGMTLDDLINEAPERRWVEWSYRNGHEKTLIVQCAYASIEDWDGSSYRYKGVKKIVIEVTPAEEAQIHLMFEIHRKPMAEFIKAQASAALNGYLLKNRIVSGRGSSGGEGCGVPDEEVARILEAMGHAPTTPVHKAIENRSDA